MEQLLPSEVLRVPSDVHKKFLAPPMAQLSSLSQPQTVGLSNPPALFAELTTGGSLGCPFPRALTIFLQGSPGHLQAPIQGSSPTGARVLPVGSP